MLRLLLPGFMLAPAGDAARPIYEPESVLD